ncbi:MAG TPA: MBOAT family protein [Candidatus Flavonifractor merdigallinarum]|uniref:MBOAT family protein n=1 Tax=Candidatus Flavonifractor merdigallinarum TaxID=2838589 RepID=A0A9D1Y8E2_9FIRM|nr:MBOAT family protein [Candidatus Flavonifractor merdigallinarum]
MVFSSLYFLFLYLPIVLFVYYITPLRWRNAWLLVVNLVFYGWGEPKYIVLMLFTILLDYAAGLVVARCKEQGRDTEARVAVAVALVLNLAILFFFKYWDLVARTFQHFGVDMPVLNLALPIGISFYTFQTMTYPVDVYRGDADAQKNVIHFGTFVTLFPQLIAGPIIKYKELADQMTHRTHSPEQFASGVQVFTVGLAKKVLLANNIGKLWDVYLALPTPELTVAGAWLGVLAFSLQLYFDFSGYSDMAVGLGRMLGFEFPRNFNYPYISKSITEFWRRWHISLGSWFREYLYIPLGGNRVSKPRLFFNLFVVWAATGIWHGASWNFLIWGLYFAVLIILEKAFLGKLLEKLPAVVQHVYALFLVLVSWAIFAVEDFGHMGIYLKAMFGSAPGGLTSPSVGYYFSSFLPTLLVACLAATPLAAKLWAKLSVKAVKVVLPVVVLAGLIFSTAYLVDASYNPFLYFRF